MLRNIPALLSPELLYALRGMGDGDDIVIADANFPAHRNGRQVIRLDGVSATDVLAAILQLMPLDTFVSEPALTMQVVGDGAAVPEVVGEFQRIVNEVADHPARLGSLERFAFYQQAREAFVIVQTGEQRLYGNIILKKGVIKP